jgi:peptide/nickel transport system substrate-binding protein
MGTTRRRFIRGAALGGAGLALAVCAPTIPGTPSGTPSGTGTAARAKRGGTLRLASAFEFASLDPTTASGGNSNYWIGQAHARLFFTGNDGKLKPDLAEKWETASDQKSVTITLRKGVTYQDGSPFDADSVKWNMERHLTHPRSVHKAALAALDRVEVVDPSTVRFVLKAAYSPFLASIASGATVMSSRKEVEAQGDAFGTKPNKAGAGPWMYKEIASGQTTFTRNPNYYGKDENGEQLPYLDELVFKVFPDSSVRFTNLRTAQADVMFDIARGDLTLAKSDTNLVVQSAPASGFLFALVNHKKGFVFEDSRLLKAVNMAVDRQELIRVAYAGEGIPAYGPVVPQLFAFDANFKPYERPDVEGAKRLIQQAGKGPLTFEMMYISGDPDLLQALQLLQSQLKKADITMTLRGVTAQQSTAEFSAGSFPGMYGITTIGNNQPDPDVALTSVLVKGGRNNVVAYENAEIEKLIVEQRATSDETKRREIIRKIEQIAVVDDPAHLFLVFPNSYMVSAKNVKGVAPAPSGRPTWERAWLDK